MDEIYSEENLAYYFDDDDYLDTKYSEDPDIFSLEVGYYDDYNFDKNE